MIPAKPEASAKAPWTRTTVGSLIMFSYDCVEVKVTLRA
jgi:hypothetical protein